MVLQIGGELESNGDGLQGMAERGAGEELEGSKGDGGGLEGDRLMF